MLTIDVRCRWLLSTRIRDSAPTADRYCLYWERQLVYLATPANVPGDPKVRHKRAYTRHIMSRLVSWLMPYFILSFRRHDYLLYPSLQRHDHVRVVEQAKQRAFMRERRGGCGGTGCRATLSAMRKWQDVLRHASAEIGGRGTNCILHMYQVQVSGADFVTPSLNNLRVAMIGMFCNNFLPFQAQRNGKLLTRSTVIA